MKDEILKEPYTHKRFVQFKMIYFLPISPIYIK